MNKTSALLLDYGPQALTDCDLLARLLRMETSKVKAIIGDTPERLLGITYEELVAMPGLGREKACTILCLAELAKRLWKKSVCREDYMKTPQDVAQFYMQEMRMKDVEELHVMFLNAKGRLLGEKMLSRGTASYAVFSTREILKEALRKGASRILMVHNHPSGEPAPSDDDRKTTKQVKAACELLGVPLVDHIIIGNQSYYSFQEEGHL